MTGDWTHSVEMTGDWMHSVEMTNPVHCHSERSATSFTVIPSGGAAEAEESRPAGAVTAPRFLRFGLTAFGRNDKPRSLSFRAKRERSRGIFLTPRFLHSLTLGRNDRRLDTLGRNDRRLDALGRNDRGRERPPHRNDNTLKNKNSLFPVGLKSTPRESRTLREKT